MHHLTLLTETHELILKVSKGKNVGENAYNLPIRKSYLIEMSLCKMNKYLTHVIRNRGYYYFRGFQGHFCIGNLKKLANCAFNNHSSTVCQFQTAKHKKELCLISCATLRKYYQFFYRRNKALIQSQCKPAPRVHVQFVLTSET